MSTYKEMYLVMFRAAEKARRILTEESFSRENAQRAALVLTAAQIESEELYIEDENVSREEL